MLSLAHKHVHQLAPLTIVSCPALTYAPRPWNMAANASNLLRREEMLIGWVAEDSEASFFVGQLRAKGVRHANFVFTVGAREWMRLVVLFQKLVDDDALVENVYAKVTGHEHFIVVSQR